MTPMPILFSRNARAQKGLIRRAQSRIDQPALAETTSELGGTGNPTDGEEPGTLLPVYSR